MTWSMRPATAADFGEIRALYETVFESSRPEQHDRWKFHENPAGGLLAVVAVDGERIVGQYALWPVVLDLGGEFVDGAQSLDTMVHPDYRGQGMFTKLAVACYELAAERGIEALYGFPNAASYPGFVNRLNWDHTGDVARYIRILRPTGVRPLPAAIGTVADAAVRLLPRGSTGDGAIDSRPPPDEEMQYVLDRTVERGTCRVRRTPEWLRWRLSPEARRDYRWATVRRNGTCVGWSVWGTREDGHGVLAEVAGVDDHAVARAVAAAVHAAAAGDVPALHAVSSVPGHDRALRRAGFIKRSGVPLIIRSMTARNLRGNIHRHDTWHLQGADLDTF